MTWLAGSTRTANRLTNWRTYSRPMPLEAPMTAYDSMGKMGRIPMCCHLCLPEMPRAWLYTTNSGMPMSSLGQIPTGAEADFERQFARDFSQRRSD